MGRYLAIYASCVRFSFQRALEFRLDFFFRVLMDGLWYAMNLTFFGLLHRHTPLLGGWDEAQVRVFAGSLFVADAMHMTFFSNNLWWFPTYVNRGDLDYHLLRPVSSLFFLSLRDFAVNSFVNLLMALGILVWALASYPEPLSAMALVAYGGAMLLGVVIHYVTLMLFTLPVFWMQGGSGMRDLFYVVDRFAGRPDGLWRGGLRRILTTIVPMALVASFPTRVLFEDARGSLLVHMLAVAAAGFAVLLFVWRRGLAAYGSASS
jgi:ABC-2 type transport system permease protein